MYTLKTIARRGTSLGAALSLAVAAVIPAVFPSGLAFADALNPLTERSLTLSSSSPGWADTDGSGNTTYAPPNSGANGNKTGNYFSFKPSSTATVKTLSFQYCTKSAGSCTVPGNGAYNVTNHTSDLNVNYPSATPVSNGDFSTVINDITGDVKAVPGYTNSNPKYSGSGDPAEAAKNVSGNFIVMYFDTSATDGTHPNGTWKPSSATWAASASNVADFNAPSGATNNYITLTSSTGENFTAGEQVKVLFFATGTNYITNPGEGAFFVKINTYGVHLGDTRALPATGTYDTTDLAPATNTNVVDGGVTVANVMNQSIQITTKVLETMEFSVGTVDPNTLSSTDGSTGVQSSFEKAMGLPSTGAGNTNPHTSCDRIATRMNSTDPENVLQLGNQTAESSLETGKAYATHSYWRLSSNSSAGATVYYSGHTLANTSGDEIAPIGATAAKHSAPGSEQFGLAIASATLGGANAYDTGNYGVNYAQDRDTGKNWENAADNDKTAVDNSVLTDLGATGIPASPDYTNLNKSYHTPRLDPLTPNALYAGGSGTINTDSKTGLGTNNVLGANDTAAAFAFDKMSDTVPAPLATENSQVVDCVTAKMRYVANIAATTPAGIYTTKINYIAAPQY